MTPPPAVPRPGMPLMAWVWLAIAFAALAAIAGLLVAPGLSRGEYLRHGHWTTDWRTALLSPRLNAPHDKVAIVAINDATLKDYASSPIDRGLLARIVRAVDAAGPRAIGVDVLFLKRTDAEKDEALAAALRDAKAAVVLGAEDERGPLEKFQREFQAEFLVRAGRPAGYLNLRRQGDDVVRYTAVPAEAGAYPKSFARLLAEAGGATAASDLSRPISWMRGRDDDLKPFLIVPAQDLLADVDLGTQLKGRIVIIGGDFPFRDRHRVPQSVRTGEQMPGAAIHGQIVAMMLEPGRAVSEVGPVWARGLVVLAALTGMWLGWRLGLSTLVTYLGWGTASILLVAIDGFAYRGLQVLLPFTLVALAWVAGLTAGRSLRTARSLRVGQALLAEGRSSPSSEQSSAPSPSAGPPPPAGGQSPTAGQTGGGEVA